MNQFVRSLSYVTSTLQQLLKEEVDATVVTTEFPDSSTAEEFAMIVSYVCNYSTCRRDISNPLPLLVIPPS